MVESVTVRYDGTIRGLRALRRRLERSGLETGFDSYGLEGGTPNLPEARLWFRLSVSGPGCLQECQAIANTWSEGTFRLS